jgi:hypothetical protein
MPGFDLWDHALNGKQIENQLTPEQLQQMGPMANVTRPLADIAHINDGMAPPNVSKWTKLKAAIGDAGTKAADTIMPTPKGLDGLLSPEDFAAARKQGLLNLGLSLLGDSGYRPANDQVSLGQALAHGAKAAQGAYGDKIDSTIKEQQFGQAAKQQQSILASRAAIAKQFVAPPNESFDDAQQRLVKMYTAYVNSGDTEMAGKLSEVVKGIHDAKPHAPISVPEGGTLVDPTTGKPIFHSPKTPPLESPGSLRSAARQDTMQKNVIVRDFDKTTKDYRTAESSYSTLQGARANPQNFLTPMAALDAFARTINPGAAVRVGTLQMIKSYGSLGQKAQRWYDMAAKGQWPPEMMGQIYSLVDGIMKDHTDEFNRARDEAVARGQDSGVDVSNILHKARNFGAASGGVGKGSNPLLGR